LSAKDVAGGLIVKCFVGCAPADIKNAIRQIMQGTPVVASTTPVRPKLTPDDMVRIVGRIEAECVRNTGTLVEVYNRRRWITVELAPTLLFHPWLYHAESGGSAPAMVALLQAADGDRVPAIHRTWLAADGSGKADLSPVRKSLGSVSGHSVHLGRPSARLIVGEGIETTLSAWQMWGFSFDAWATLSTSGMAALIVPTTVTEVVIASDNDPAGQQAAAALRDRLLRENPARKVTVYTPKGDVSDFNDVLAARMAA
jgi:hypothetical protein